MPLPLPQEDLNGNGVQEETLVRWLEFHQSEIDSTADILKDEIGSITTRKIKRNLSILQDERRPESVRLGKSIIVGYNDAIAKAIKNLQSLSVTMTKELQQRFALPDEWLETCSTVVSVAGSEVFGPTFPRKYFDNENRMLSFLNDSRNTNETAEESNKPNDMSGNIDSSFCIPNGYVKEIEGIEKNLRGTAYSKKDCSTANPPYQVQNEVVDEDVETIPASDEETLVDANNVFPEKIVMPSSESKQRQRVVIKQEVFANVSNCGLNDKSKTICRRTKSEPDHIDPESSDSDASGKTSIMPIKRNDSAKLTHSSLGNIKREISSVPEDASRLTVVEKESTKMEENNEVNEGHITVNIFHPDDDENQDFLADQSDLQDPNDWYSQSLLEVDETRTVVMPIAKEKCTNEEQKLSPKADDKIKKALSKNSEISNRDKQPQNTSSHTKRELNHKHAKRSEKELEAMMDILGSDSDFDGSVHNARGRQTMDKPKVKKPETVHNRKSDCLNDTKLQDGVAVVKLDRLEPNIEKCLINHGYVTLKDYNKFKKRRYEVLDTNSSTDYSDRDSSVSDDSVVELDKALKRLTRNSMVHTMKYNRKSGQRKKPLKIKRAKRKYGSGSEDDSYDSFSDDTDDTYDQNKKYKLRNGLVTAINTISSCSSESEDLESWSEIDEEVDENSKSNTKTSKQLSHKTTTNKKKYYKIASISSSSDSEKDNKRYILGQDSDSDIPEKSRKSKKPARDSDSDVSVTRKTGKRIKSEVNSDHSLMTIESDADSDFKESSKKRLRGHDGSPDGKRRKKKRRRRILQEDSGDSEKPESNNSDIEEIPQDEMEASCSQKGRKNIRNIMSKKTLSKTTREAEKEEEERRKRLSEKQKSYNEFREGTTDTNQLEKIRLVLDSNSETTLEVDPSISSHLKPHQADGIKFMYGACFESIQMIKEDKIPGGCILAHCMGLGKTLQSVAFIHTLLNNPICKVETVLVICPLSTVNNWYNEFRNWTKDATAIKIHKLYDGKSSESRVEYLRTWKKRGGVGIVHYDLFRLLADPNGKSKLKENIKAEINSILLNPGPDLVICDEGHMLKNWKSLLSLAVNNISTKRRIVLTGTPLQNNLIEYHTMMNFVKPNLLGSLPEFTNRFVNPIRNGQHADSTDADVKVMKRRAHVLHRKLEGCVQRRDYLILEPYLLPKFEYTIQIKLSDKQETLYKYYLHKVVDSDLNIRKKNILKYYSELVKVWSHPIALTMGRSNRDEATDESPLKDLIFDEGANSVTSECDSSESTTSDGRKKAKAKERSHGSKNGEPSTVTNPSEGQEIEKSSNKWWKEVYSSKSDMCGVDVSGKIVVLQQILKTCESIGDKVLVFSQYLSSLDIIEDFLADWNAETERQHKNRSDGFPLNDTESNGIWRRDIEYFRIDGQTKVSDRHRDCEIFNEKSAFSRAKLFLISTRAGGLGINLYGANRVVIFDASWNPSQDMQSIFRVYRLGQNKPCYVYRLIARGTMEEKILRRQITKLSLAHRVVDEHQIERHFKFDDVNEMYRYDKDISLKDTLAVPKDRLLADLLISHSDWIRSYEEFNSLLENKTDEGLSNEEKELAWREYESERQRQFNANNSGLDNNATFSKVQQRLKDRNPNATPEQIDEATHTSLKVIENIRQRMLHQNRLPADHRQGSDPSLDLLKAWLQKALQEIRPAGAPIPQANDPILPPLPIAFESQTQQNTPVSQVTGVQYNARSGTSMTVRQPGVFYNEGSLPTPQTAETQELYNRFRNVAAGTVYPNQMGHQVWNPIQLQTNQPSQQGPNV